MTLRSAFMAAALALPALPALAQPPAATPSRHPADPGATVAPVVHVSPFAAYRPFVHANPAPWRGVNDEVARIGGWKAYAREVYEAQQQSPAKGEAPPAAPPHHGHGGK